MLRTAFDTGRGVSRSKFVHAPGSPRRAVGTARRIAPLDGLQRRHACITADEKNHIF